MAEVTARTAYLLVTGSRTIRDYDLVANALDQAWTDAVAEGFTRLVIVHGAAQGADSLAQRWYFKHRARGVEQHRFPADWQADCGITCNPTHRRTRSSGGTYCPTEGNFRNQRMVDHLAEHVATGAVMALVFHADAKPSAGTADCRRRAIKAGIPVREFQAVPKETARA